MQPPPAEEAPRVAVVIATHGRAAMLAETLDALERQTVAGVEVIVVDDGSPDETPQLLADRHVRTIRTERQGPGRARQVGWREASALIVAFTDDDCVPADDWLEHLIAPIESDEADFVQGRTRPRPDQAHRLDEPFCRTQHVEHANEYFQTCNIAYRRSVLDAVGGFHPDFVGGNTSGEDTELGWRAREHGFRPAFAAGALVHHVVWPGDYPAFLRDRRRWAMVIQIIKLHPDARRLAHRSWFYRPSHLRMLAGVVLLTVLGVIRRWLPLAVVAAAASALAARAVARGEQPGPALRLTGQYLVADAVEVGVFIRGSIRYRTMLL